MPLKTGVALSAKLEPTILTWILIFLSSLVHTLTSLALLSILREMSLSRRKTNHKKKINAKANNKKIRPKSN